jgi:oligoribonuclease
MKLLWLDLETTGLNPREDDVLEVAYAFADLKTPFEITPTVPGSSLIKYRWLPAYWDPFVRDMHTKNGLIAELELDGLNTRGAAEVERKLLGLVPEEPDREERTVLAGSTVSFDLEFLRCTMPTLASRLSHRVYDVSAVKLFCRSLGMPKLPKQEAHRATADVLESIEHAKACAEWLKTYGTTITTYRWLTRS